jgi:hypothetical protein
MRGKRVEPSFPNRRPSVNAPLARTETAAKDMPGMSPVGADRLPKTTRRP